MGNAITVQELAERGMDERLAEIINLAIGDALPPRCLGLSREEMEALGYGPSCACGERGLAIGEQECQECGDGDSAP